MLVLHDLKYLTNKIFFYSQNILMLLTILSNLISFDWCSNLKLGGSYNAFCLFDTESLIFLFDIA